MVAMSVRYKQIFYRRKIEIVPERVEKHVLGEIYKQIVVYHKARPAPYLLTFNLSRVFAHSAITKQRRNALRRTRT